MSVFLDIIKITDFQSANVSRSQGVSLFMLSIFLDLLYVSCNCAKFHHCRICVTDFREG